ncbi:MAG: peptide chain release factor 1 [Eubacteriales bacterium]|nr:peptide chain release factor 1 [Eubacteriales bacterium]
MLNKIRFLKEKFLEIEKEMLLPEIIADNKKYTELCKEYNELEPISQAYDDYSKILNTMQEDEKSLETETDNELRSLLNSEIEDCKKEIEKLDEHIKILLLPKDDNDELNVILEIRSGAGGEEASLFGGVLLRMYSMYAESKRWKVEILSANETELGGIKEAQIRISGKCAYSKFKYESGVHRVQRVPETESSGRIHTSTATVAVLPEHEEVDVDINDKDLQIDVYRSGGAGGQHVNTTDSAVRITHLPTGIVVACQDERSQLKNREKAMSILKSKLYDYFQMQVDEEYANNRRNQIGTGDRSERIRTYNYPQSRLTDHRINYTSYNLEAFLNGDLDDLISNLSIAEQKEKLEKITL